MLLGKEDGLGDTVLPRLAAMGADLGRIHTIRGENVTFGDDLKRIEEVIRETSSVLVIVDPLSQFLGVGNQEQRVRKVLTRVRLMAENHGVALLAIRHLAKQRLAAQLAGIGWSPSAPWRARGSLAPDPSDGKLGGEPLLGQVPDGKQCDAVFLGR